MKYTLQELERMKDKSGNLDLAWEYITELPDNLMVGGWLDLYETPITSLPDNLTIGRWLGLMHTYITSLPDNLTVGGHLDLRNTNITLLPDNLTVGGDLYLNGTKITSLPDNLSVGGRVFTDDLDTSKVKRLKQGEESDEWVYADGILTHIEGKKQIKGYTFYIGKIKGENVLTDGTHYAHCKTFKDGVIDLEFKKAKERGAEQYKSTSLDKEFTIEEAVTMYRIITGACRQGSENFVNSLGKLKDKYTLKEIIEITKGQYGSAAFQKFFI